MLVNIICFSSKIWRKVLIDVFSSNLYNYGFYTEDSINEAPLTLHASLQQN